MEICWPLPVADPGVGGGGGGGVGGTFTASPPSPLKFYQLFFLSHFVSECFIFKAPISQIAWESI